MFLQHVLMFETSLYYQPLYLNNKKHYHQYLSFVTTYVFFFFGPVFLSLCTLQRWRKAYWVHHVCVMLCSCIWGVLFHNKITLFDDDILYFLKPKWPNACNPFTSVADSPFIRNTMSKEIQSQVKIVKQTNLIWCSFIFCIQQRTETSGFTVWWKVTVIPNVHRSINMTWAQYIQTFLTFC